MSRRTRRKQRVRARKRKRRRKIARAVLRALQERRDPWQSVLKADYEELELRTMATLLRRVVPFKQAP